MISDDLLTRYQNALVQITSFWQDCDIKIYDLESIDEAVSLYLEFIFSEGEPKGLASDTLASVQFFLPSASGKLRHSWKLVKTWQKIEPPTRLIPMSPFVVKAFAGACIRANLRREAACLLLCFDAMLRPGELYNILVKDITFYNSSAVITLRDTKTGKRKGNDEMVVVESVLACQLLRQAIQTIPPSHHLLSMSPYRFRTLFKNLVAHFQLSGAFGLYSLRRGGATFDFLRHNSMERTLLRGRWSSSSTARVYLQHTVAAVYQLELSPLQRAHLHLAATALTW